MTEDTKPFELKLKLRKIEMSGLTINLPLMQARAFVQSGNGEQLIKLLKNGMEKVVDTIHDLRWLIMLVDWTPQDGEGITQRQRARWLQFIHKINELEDTPESFEKEYSIQINTRMDKLIWNRIQDARFIAPANRAWDMFVYDYIEASGRDIESLSED